MRSLRSFGVLSAVTVMVLFSSVGADAAPVTYEFAGTCFSGSSPGDCAYFGLSDGDAISGYLTLDRDRLAVTGFTTFLPGDPDLDFSFTFGSFSVSKSNLDPNLDIRVMLSDPNGLGIVLQNSIRACVNAVSPCYLVQTGTESLEIGTSFGFASRATDFGSEVAYTSGEWTRASSVPEPPFAGLVALGVVALASKTRGARRVN